MNGKKISKNREKKEQLVAGIAEKVGKSKAMVFTNYQGMSHKQLEELRRTLSEANAELVITKNTLLKLSLEKKSIKADGREDGLTKPTAVIFAYEDVFAPLKHLAKTLKKIGLPTIKFGIMDNQALDSDQVLKLASLPPKEILLAQVVGGLKSPIFGLHRALNWNLQKLVMTLDAVARLPRPEPSDGEQAQFKPAVILAQPEPAPSEPVTEAAQEIKTEEIPTQPVEANEKAEESKAESIQETEVTPPKAGGDQKSEGGEN